VEVNTCSFLSTSPTVGKQESQEIIEESTGDDSPPPPPAVARSKPTCDDHLMPGKPAKPVLLAGGNPQIPKGDGDAPVQAYLDAMPGWKGDIGRALDTLIVHTVPEVEKAVRWNSPFYGVEGLGWFLSFHCFTRYVKVTLFAGASLEPVPPESSKDVNARYVHLHEGEELDEELLVSWVEQASRIPGWITG
jgi:hypothetical protein